MVNSLSIPSVGADFSFECEYMIVVEFALD